MAKSRSRGNSRGAAKKGISNRADCNVDGTLVTINQGLDMSTIVNFSSRKILFNAYTLYFSYLSINI